MESLLEQLVSQVGNLVKVVNWVGDKLGVTGNNLRRLDSELITQTKTVREETETEKGEERKNKEKKKEKEKMEVDGLEREVIKIRDSDMEGVEEGNNNMQLAVFCCCFKCYCCLWLLKI